VCSVGLHAPLPHPHQDWAPPPPPPPLPPTSAPGPGSPFQVRSRSFVSAVLGIRASARQPATGPLGGCAALILVMLLGLVMLGLAVETAVEHMVSCWSPFPLRPVPA
jgi:hypothetical protein